MSYPNTQLYIGGHWRAGSSDHRITVRNPATDQVIGHVEKATIPDLDEALAAAASGFEAWKRTSVLERSRTMRRASDLLRERVDAIARIMTAEQGKPLVEARTEILAAADIVDWFAEEARRTYGRVIPARAQGVYQLSLREPVGPVAAFTPWNFPINQVVRKVGPALAAGCSIIVKGPEETPASPAEVVRCFADAGVPAGVLNLVFGDPAEISSHLIPHPVIRKISFTGSVPVGKHLAAMAGQHMKRATMELGGHGPAIIFEDADLAGAARALVTSKYRNAGQVCVAPTRFIVQEPVFDEFIAQFTSAVAAIKVGDGMQEGTQMGPLINSKRLGAIEALVADAASKGAKIETGGRRIGNEGYFYEPTVLSSLDTSMDVMNEEPFGPLALMVPFKDLGDALAEANRLPFGLAAYAWTRSVGHATAVGAGLESGMVTINHLGLALAETPFGGVKDSGYGSEGGTEAMEAYLTTKFVSQAGL